MGKMKPVLLVPILVFPLLASCTTLQNRRDLYFPQAVDGPYTRMLKDGSWRKKPVADSTVSTDGLPDSSTDSKQVKSPSDG